MRVCARWLGRLAVTGGALGSVLVGVPSAASAHPLGNATVNHYNGLHLYPDRLTDLAVEDIAEIPTLQRKSEIDTDGDRMVSDAERSAYAARQCSSLAAANVVQANGQRVALSVTHSDYTERPGVIQLVVGRLVCELAGTVDLTAPSTVSIEDRWDGDGIGWHEITAVGRGVSLKDSPVPEQSVSDTLLRYPNDLLSSPLDQRSAVLTVVPGAAASTYAAARKIPVAGVAVRELNKLSTAFNSVVGAEHLTLGVGLLAIVLSVLLGAGHAFLPGHGKTIMAAYLVGRQGRLRDVVTVGATVTVTHTAGVLVLGLLISLTAAFAPTAAEQGLAVLSGLIVAAVGVFLLASALHRARSSAGPSAGAEVVLSDMASSARPVPVLVAGGGVTGLHPGVAAHPWDAGVHEEADSHLHEATRVHSHGSGHRHPHSHPESHPHRHGAAPRFGRAGLVGLGVAGGLVPSPSALLVLLAAVALGRTVFGVVLVLGYGLGMAGALMATGLLLVSLRNRLARLTLGRHMVRTHDLLRLMPVLTALLVLVVGAGLVLRALGGSV